MASEGEFPKVDGDVLYASEVNALQTPVITSGTTVFFRDAQTTTKSTNTGGYTTLKTSYISSAPPTGSFNIIFEAQTDSGSAVAKLYARSMGTVGSHVITNAYSSGLHAITSLLPGDDITISIKHFTGTENSRVKNYQFVGSLIPNTSIMGVTYITV